MKFTRRRFVSTGTTGLIMGMSPLRSALAQTQLGRFTLTSLSDGTLTLPVSMTLEGVPEDQRASISEQYDFSDVMTPPCNVTLLQTDERNILFDVGAGPEFMSSAGFLTDALDDIGLAPEDITDVVFTHAHPDHLWGVVDDFDDLLFTNAAYMMGEVEWAYWMDPNTVDTIDDGRTTFAVGAARRLERIAERMSFFKDGDEILPGVAARATFGHTPGHMAFEVRQDTDALMILGDCIGNHHVAFSHPAWPTASDQDQETGIATRTALLDQLASDQIQILGFHLPGTGIGRVEKAGSAYRFVQDS